MDEVQRRRFGNTWIFIAGVVTAVSLCVAGWAVYSRYQQSDERREQQANFNASVRSTLRDLLCFFEATSLERADSQAQMNQVVLFYNAALKQIGARPCDIPKREGP